MTIYSLGFFAIFFIFFLLHLHAYRKRAELELSVAEEFLTRMELYGHAIYMSVALLSVGIAQFVGPGGFAWTGWCYFIIGPLRTVFGVFSGRRLKKLLAAA